ncbi:hypothetical protein LTS02_003750 [Friedmanniomyces endolithicus]|nr:hypothetical protein LTR03_007847 [Friedmanniomyces endolithicus]KAK0868229.1 hypothetical protein LTS02_003750 [Friedmanniomyces endolithicus]KAK0991644.1 hypothetical protein LTS01_008148 [Friedmanniomyces endolithicus]
MADSTRLPSTSGFFLSGQDNGEILNIIHIDCKHRTFPSKLRYRRAWNAGFACDAAWRSELRFGRNHFNMSFSSSAFASRTEEKRQLPGLGWPGSPFLGLRVFLTYTVNHDQQAPSDRQYLTLAMTARICIPFLAIAQDGLVVS